MESKKPISHLIAGLIIGAIIIIFSMTIRFLGLEEVRGIQWINILIIIAGLILFINLYGKAMNNQVTFGNLFGYGFKSTAVFILVIILFTVIFLLMFPDIKEKGFETARNRMSEKGDLTGDEIDRRMELVRRMFWVFTIGGLLLVNAVVGAIGSLIGAAITKKKPVNPVDQLSI